MTGIDPEVGCWNNVKITVLNNDGSNKQYEDGDFAGVNIEYFWTDDGHNGDYGGAPGWYGVDGMPMDGSSAAGLASAVTFAVGEGICFYVDLGFEAARLESSGQVVTGQTMFTFNTDANVFVANPLARPVTLDELTIGGVDPDVGCWNNIKITVLNNDGSNKQYADGDFAGVNIEYFWTDDGHDGGYGGTPGWYGVDGMPMDGSSAAGLASDVQIGIGEAHCFYIDLGFENCFVLFPSLGLKAE